MKLKERLANFTLLLASASPRRRELLSAIDLPFEIELNSSEVDESLDGTPPSEIEALPQQLSLKKSLTFHRTLKPNELLITADTLVFLNGEILGKPVDREEAIEMLSTLSQATHKVVTAVTIRSDKGVESFSSTTKVTFKKLLRSEIEYYVDNYNPYDKAGGYGAQDWIGHTAIKKIEGCFFTVIGFPIVQFGEELLLFLDKFYPIVGE